MKILNIFFSFELAIGYSTSEELLHPWVAARCTEMNCNPGIKRNGIRRASYEINE